jgi:hypothetical protein
MALVYHGHYADMEPRPQMFILADQWDGTLLLGVLHTLALVHFLTAELVAIQLAKRGLNGRT